MNLHLNPITYFIRRYHSAELKPNELKRMLNLWLPFLFNRIKIIRISDDFSEIDVRLKHTIWNRNPSKGIWGGSIFSAMDPFYPIMLKQTALHKGMKTDFFTKGTEVKYLKEAKTDLMFNFKLTQTDLDSAMDILKQSGKYEGWHQIDGIDKNGERCITGRIQSYLRLRK